MKTLVIPKGDGFGSANTALINEYSWGGEYHPKAQAALYHTDTALHIRMDAWEDPLNLRIYEYGISEDACDDSCLEFFIMPYPEKDKRYFNFEFTLSGAIYLGLGNDRYDNVLLKDCDLTPLDIRTYMENEKGTAHWWVTAIIPYAFIEEKMGIKIPFEKGLEMTGNFYKCSNKCRIPHWGSWNVIEGKCDFHLPQFFGKFILD